MLFPQFYGAHAFTILPNQRAPQNTDIPHLEHAVFSRKAIKAGEHVEILLSIRDTGRNLENPSGIHVMDHKQRDLAPRAIGFGYALVAFVADVQAHGGENLITVSLHDLSGNRNTQSLSFEII